MKRGIYRRRRLRSHIFMGLSVFATVFSIGWLALIVGALLYQGLTGINADLFTQSTPPPATSGGLLNAIAGSAIMTVIAIVGGTPIGIFAGTWLGEYGRHGTFDTLGQFMHVTLADSDRGMSHQLLDHVGAGAGLP